MNQHLLPKRTPVQSTEIHPQASLQSQATMQSTPGGGSFGLGMSSAQALLHRLSAELLLFNPDVGVVQIFASVLLDALSQHMAGISGQSFAENLAEAVSSRRAVISAVLNREETYINSNYTTQTVPAEQATGTGAGSSWQMEVAENEHSDNGIQTVETDTVTLAANRDAAENSSLEASSDEEEVQVLDFEDNMDPSLAQDLQRHIISDPLRVEVETSKTSGHSFYYRCQICKMAFAWRRHLEVHLIDHRAAIRKHMCHVCGKAFKRGDHLTRHASIHRTQTFPCQLCGDISPSAVNLELHWKSQHQNITLDQLTAKSSSQVSQGGTERSATERQRESVGSVIPPSQLVRELQSLKATANKRASSDHSDSLAPRQVHSHQRLLRSPRRQSSSQLTPVGSQQVAYVHYVGHDSPGNVTEPVSDAFFTRLPENDHPSTLVTTRDQQTARESDEPQSSVTARRQLLQQKSPAAQMRTEKSITPASSSRPQRTMYSCHVCGRAFDRQAHLNRHVRIHSGEKPYMCPICQKVYTRRDYVRSHILQVHDKSRVKCKACSKVFATISGLRRHNCPVVIGGKLRTWYLQSEFMDIPVDAVSLVRDDSAVVNNAGVQNTGAGGPNHDDNEMIFEDLDDEGDLCGTEVIIEDADVTIEMRDSLS